MNWMILPLKRYAEFSGRSRRREFWMWTLFQFLLGIAFVVLMMVIGGAAALAGAERSPGSLMAAGGGIFILTMLWFVVWLAMLIPGLAVTVRRLHDSNRTGKWLAAYVAIYVLYWVGSIGFAFSAARGQEPGAGGMVFAGLLGLLLLGGGLTLLVFMFLDGTPGPNRYGEDPKGRGAIDAEVFA